MSKDGPTTALPASFRYAAALVSAMLVSSFPMPVLSQETQLVVVNVHEVAEGYRMSKLIGSSVVNDQTRKSERSRTSSLEKTKPFSRCFKSGVFSTSAGVW